MMNNSGAYGPNEAPPNMVASIHSSQNNANQNLNDYSKFMQQTSSLASEYYEAHNLHNFSNSSINMPPIYHPFNAYQTMTQGFPHLPQTTQKSFENTMQGILSGSSQHDYNNSLQNRQKNSEEIIPNELSYNCTIKENPLLNNMLTGKSSPLSIPKVLSKTFQTSSSITITDKNVQNITDNSIASADTEEPLNMVEKKSSLINKELEESQSNKELSPVRETIEEDTSKDQVNVSEDSSENVSKSIFKNQNITKLSPPSPNIMKTSYNIIKNSNNPSKLILKKCLTESKRKSLEKTITLIESILIKTPTSTLRSEAAENVEDPLEVTPNIEIKQEPSDSDNETLITKVETKRKKQNPTKNTNTSEYLQTSNEAQKSKEITIKVEDIKIERNWTDVEYENPFSRDVNGVLRDSVGDVKIIDLESSVEEATSTIKTGSTSMAYFECPHCSLLLRHPKRFLIHTKWHSFGLLNEKRAEMQREREERTRERREARAMQRLSASLAAVDASEPTFPCKDCDMIFPTKTSLKNHRHRSHPKNAVTHCRICMVEVSDWRSLREHMDTHEDKLSGGHPCPHCPKRFKYRHSLIKHADTHLEKSHSCGVCGKLFGSMALVRSHNATHERTNKGIVHHCSYCGKGFYETYNLHVHERTHRNDKPFKCETCQSSFVTNSSLKRHMKVSHGGAKPFSCPVCQKCFANANIRDRHELRVHADPKHLPIACDQCDRRFVKMKDLRNHTYRWHPKDKNQKTDSDAEQNST